MKLAEGVTSKLGVFLMFVGKYINIFVEKIYERGATPLVGLDTETV